MSTRAVPRTSPFSPIRTCSIGMPIASSKATAAPLEVRGGGSVVPHRREVREVPTCVEALGDLHRRKLPRRAQRLSLDELRPDVTVASPREPPFLARAG